MASDINNTALMDYPFKAQRCAAIKILNVHCYMFFSDGTHDYYTIVSKVYGQESIKVKSIISDADGIAKNQTWICHTRT